MSTNKTPRSDNFTIHFFQVYWDKIKHDITIGLTHLFLGRSLMREVNHTFIMLVSKVEGAERMEEFRPISYMNTIHKIHAKLIVGRLAEVVPDLLSRIQVAFTARWLIGEHYKRAKEMVHYFGHKSTLRCFCMFVDLRKTCDTIYWLAIKATLTILGFSVDF